jgi:hypothetical protein
VVVLSSLTKKGKKKKKKTKGLEIQGLVSVRIPGLQEFGASSLIQKASGDFLFEVFTLRWWYYKQVVSVLFCWFFSKGFGVFLCDLKFAN